MPMKIVELESTSRLVKTFWRLLARWRRSLLRVAARDFVSGQSKLNIRRLPAIVLWPSWRQGCERDQTADLDVGNFCGGEDESIRPVPRHHDHARRGGADGYHSADHPIGFGQVVSRCRRCRFSFHRSSAGYTCKTQKADKKGLLLLCRLAYVQTSAPCCLKAGKLVRSTLC